MGFTNKRGRPKKNDASKLSMGKDLGTAELQFKRAQGLTKEVIDLAKEKRLIDDEQYSAACISAGFIPSVLVRQL